MGMAVLWVFASLLAAALVLGYLFVDRLEHEVRRDLEASLTRIVALLDVGSPTLRLTSPMTDPRYETPLSGSYWQIEVPQSGGLLRSRSLWDMAIPTPATDTNDLIHSENADGVHLIALSRLITAGDRTFRVTVARDHGPVHDAATAFGWDIARLFTLLGLVILVAAWLQLRLGLAPLDRLRAAIDAVRQGEQPRLAGTFPDEVQPLVEEVNALLEEREANTERARERASDLAHGLKTPLAALHGIALRVRDGGLGHDADLIDDLAFEMSKRVDYQMRLATLRLRAGAHRESTALNIAVIRTLTVLKKTGRGAGLHWVAELPEDCNVDINRQDLMELLGVTLENAAKWAASRVLVRSTRMARAVRLEIVDDGPGVPAERLTQLGRRGKRLDERAPGTGLGLAIAAEILALNGGEMAFAEAEGGGLSVGITLPLSGSAGAL